MNSGVIQLLVLAGVAIFLILKLKNVLGTRDGFEKPALREDPRASAPNGAAPTFRWSRAGWTVTLSIM